MKCKYCGEEIDDDSVFCEQCGARVVNEIPDDNRENPNSNSKKYVWYVLEAVAVVVLIGIIVLGRLGITEILILVVVGIIGLLLYHFAFSDNGKKTKNNDL